MSQEQILAVICQLVNEGKSITTALVKSRVTGRVPLFAITSAINQYKSNPEEFVNRYAGLQQTQKTGSKNNKDQQQIDNNENKEQRIASLEKRVAQLEQALKEITKQLS